MGRSSAQAKPSNCRPRYVGERDFAWVDDRLGVDATAWAGHRSAAAFLRDIDPATGLTRGDIDALLEFAANLTK